MDILDKLFSREIKRRTGERAIKIDATKKAAARKRFKLLGSASLKSTQTQTKAKTKKPKNLKATPPKDEILSNNTNSSLFQRINIRYPWLKLVGILIIGFIAILDLLDLTISKIGDPYNKISVAPMSQHVRVSERNLFNKRLVALTFDDGPNEATTSKLLDVLLQKDAVATFFMLGQRAKNSPDLVRRVENEGSEVASHTMYHQNLPRISAAAATDDINEAKAVFRDILGHSVAYTRPPYGNISDVVRTKSETPLILWSVDTLDWQNHDPAAILANTQAQVFDGAIILMHDIYDTSVEAVPRIIDELRAAGYEFATISEIVKHRNLKLDNGTSYRSFDL